MKAFEAAVVELSLSLSTASLVIVCFYDLTHGGEEGGEDEEHHQDAGVADAAHGPGPGDQRLLESEQFYQSNNSPGLSLSLVYTTCSGEIETRGNNKLQTDGSCF